MPDKIRDIVIKIISKPSLGMKDKNFISSLGVPLGFLNGSIFG